MRVIAGMAKGHRLVAPRGRGTRPTSDRVKESLFAALMHHLPEARVLDLYAGSGALGIEALSRGASHATFVESQRPALDVIAENLATTKLEPRATVVRRDILVALRQLEQAGEFFDVVLIDPPYDIHPRELADTLAGVVAVTQPGAQVRVEQASRRAQEVRWPEEFTAQRVRRYGDTSIIEAVRAG